MTKTEVTPIAKFFTFDRESGGMNECSIIVPEENFIIGCHDSEDGCIEVAQRMFNFHNGVMKEMTWDSDEESVENKKLHEKGLEILQKVVDSFRGQ